MADEAPNVEQPSPAEPEPEVAERPESEADGGVWPPVLEIPQDARVKPSGPTVTADRVVVTRSGQTPEPRT